MFENINNIFNSLSINEITKERALFYGYDKRAILTRPKKTNIENIHFDELGRYEVFFSDSTSIDILYFPSNQKKLYISLSSGIAFGEKRPYPTFTRWSYYNIFDGIYICIEDPMYKKYPNGGVMWFFNKKNDSYVYYIKKLIQEVIKIYDICIENVYFLGSSMGGAISIMLGNICPNSNVIAMNPQYDPASFSEPSKRFFLKEFHVNLSDKQINNFDFLPHNVKTSYFIITNVSSPKDAQQIRFFSKKSGLPIIYGIHQYDNILLWNHLSGENHSTFPEKLLFIVVLYYSELLKKKIDLSSLQNLNIVFSEILYQKSVLYKKI